MAEKKLLQLTIARVDEPVFVGPVQQVTVPGTEGEMTILPQHTSLVSALRAGVITLVDEAGVAQSYEVTGGTLEIHNNQATILL
jgi:F-type H+-transporting ATPase subunit epsilon